jgi:signal transduction histidine kinase
MQDEKRETAIGAFPYNLLPELYSLSNRIAGIYSIDSLTSNTMHDIACRLIAKHLGVYSVSILLYKGSSDSLSCVGQYINSNQVLENSLFELKKNSIKYVAQYIDVLEFLILTKEIADLQSSYYAYINYRFRNPIPTDIEEFAFILEHYSQLEKSYLAYKKNRQNEQHEIALRSTINGLFYFALTHIEQRPVWEKEFRKRKLFVSQSRVVVAKLGKSIARNSTSLGKVLQKIGIVINDGFYVGIPLEVNNRPIGILRILTNDKIEKEANIQDKDSVNKEKSKEPAEQAFCTEQLIYSYLLRIGNIQTLAFSLSLHIDNYSYYSRFRQIAFRNDLRTDLINFNNTADEITEITNCHSCIIGFADSKQGNVSIKGYSTSSSEYLKKITEEGDFLIDHVTGHVKKEILNLLYLSNNEDGPKLQSVKLDFRNKKVNNIEFYALDQNNNLKSYNGINRQKLKKINSSLSQLFNTNEHVSSELGVGSILFLPLHGKPHGFILLTNTSNSFFSIKDSELTISAVKRMEVELKITSWNQENFQHGLRTIFHQLMSPVVSLRNNIINIRDGTLTPEKRDLRLNEMLDTYTNFSDMLSAHQFFFDFAIHGGINPKIKSLDIFSFVREKVKTYQLKAKMQKGVNITIVGSVGTTPFVKTDPELLSHILQCLLDNAIKYSFNHLKNSDFDTNINYASPNVPNVIYVGVRCYEYSFEINVENWGCRIDPSEVNRIKKFGYRGRQSLEFDASGSGLGLYLVDTIVAAMNGELLITTEGNHTSIKVIFKSIP